MLRLYIPSILFFLCVQRLHSQELYIMTEPASNMPSNSIGIRLTNKLMPMQYNNTYSYRLEPEIMFAINKHVMVHTNLYASDMFTKKFRIEGGSLYAKYRFISLDELHSHFRMAAFGKVSLINNPSYIEHTVQHQQDDGTLHEQTTDVYSQEIDLDGNNSGIASGVIATKLLHKLAISASASYTQRWNNVHAENIPFLNRKAINYSLSAGYLLFPRSYKNYKQTNVNLYLEMLGSNGVGGKGYYIDAAPGVQFILNSISRIDVACRTQVSGDMMRYNKTSWLLRFEYNFLNVFTKKTT
ncbi:MAG: hypothetical protein QM802_24345 [Agriterribacter sp.]